MIHGHKENGYFVTQDRDGNKIEGSTRQCVHCQAIWQYVPGSGIRRGYCVNCDGFVCARPECFAQQKKWISWWLERTAKVRSCIPFDEWNSRLAEKVLHRVDNYTITESGVLIPRES